MATSSPAPAALSDFFKPGIVLQDRNADGVIDFVDVRVVLAPRPSAGELSAAADLAARLGFETSAMTLPVAHGKPDAAMQNAAVFVGAASLAGSGTTAAAIGATALGEGEGVVAAFGVAGKPSVAIVGADENGLAAAAVMLSGHLPYV